MTEDLGDRLEPALSREEYLGEPVWARECERIFGRTWCAVGREEDVAGPRVRTCGSRSPARACS